MNSRQRMLVSAIVLLVVGLASGASATVKYTPVLNKASSDSFLCRVLNFSNTDATYVISIVSFNGTPLASSNTITTAPGNFNGFIFGGPAISGYCKVEGKFSKSKTHVSFCITASAGSSCQTTVGDPGLK